MTKSHKVVSNLPKCPTQLTLMRQKKKKIFGKMFFRVGFSHEYKHTVKEGSQSSMETEPKHFRAILMRTLALKNLHPLLSQPGYLQEKRREGRRESHLQET